MVYTARELRKQQLLVKKAQYGIIPEDPPAAEKAAIPTDMLDLPEEDFDLASEEVEGDPEQPSVVEGERRATQPAALEGEPEPAVEAPVETQRERMIARLRCA